MTSAGEPRVVRAGAVPGVQAVRRSTGEALGRVASLSEAAGLQVLGVAIEELAPGHRSSPPHAHTQVEEAVLVLAGRATVVVGEREIELQPGDFVAFPPAGELHHIENRGAEPATLLALRAEVEGDRVRYEPGAGPR